MYCKCANCEAVLDWDELDRVPVGVSEYWGVPRTEYADVCPHCGCEDLEEYKEEEDVT